MAVKPLKIKIKEPTPSAADRMYARQQAIRKAKGLPEPSDYLKRAAEKQKEIDAMRNEPPHSNEEGKFMSGPGKSVKRVQSQATPRVNEETELDEGDKMLVQNKSGGRMTVFKKFKDIYKKHGYMPVPGTRNLGEEVKEPPTSLKSGHDEKKAKEVASKAKGNLVKGRQQSAGKDKAGKKLKKEEVEQLDELSPATKASYKSKAQAQVKELKPWTKKGEYKDLAKNLIAKRQKGIAKVSEESEIEEQLYHKERFVSGPVKKPFKSDTIASPKNEDVDKMIVQNKAGGRMKVYKIFKDIYKKH